MHVPLGLPYLTILSKMKDQECLLIVTGLWGVGWGVSVILVGQNLIIIPPVKHNFDHNTLVSRVTPESIVLYFSSMIRQTLESRVDRLTESGHLSLNAGGRQPPTPSLYRAALLQGLLVRSFLHRSSVSDHVLCPAFHHLQLFPAPWQPSRPRVYLFRWYRTSPPPYK